MTQPKMRRIGDTYLMEPNLPCETPLALNRCSSSMLNAAMLKLLREDPCSTFMETRVPDVPENLPRPHLGDLWYGTSCKAWCFTHYWERGPVPLRHCEGPGEYSRLELCIETVVTVPPLS